VQEEVWNLRISKTDYPCCACCGEKMLIFLTIDHIGLRTKEEQDKDLGGKDLSRYLQNKKFPPRRQVLCWNCNSAKSDTRYCPHKLT